MSKPKILIIGAMNRELHNLLSTYNCLQLEKLQGIYPVWRSRIERPFEVLVLQTFVGDIHASISTALALNFYNPDYVFKIGCVGGSSKGLHTGDIVIPLGFFSTTSWITRSNIDNSPTSDASVWQSVFGNKPCQVNSSNLGGQPYYFEPDANLIDKYKVFFQNRNEKLTPCFIGGGNMWSFDLKYTQNASFAQIPGQKNGRTWAADMESYAIAQTCHVFKKPFMGFYRISDNHFENEQYVPKKVAGLFNKNFTLTLDSFLQNLVR